MVRGTGKKHTLLFFFLLLRKGILTALNIDVTPSSKDPKLISNLVTGFYGKLYEPKFNAKDSSFLEKIHTISLQLMTILNLCVTLICLLMKLTMHYFQGRKANHQELSDYLLNFIYTFGKLLYVLRMHQLKKDDGCNETRQYISYPQT